MSQQIPFFELFPSLPLSRDLRVLLNGAFLTAAEVERANRTMDLALTVPRSLGEREAELTAAVAEAYALSRVSIRQTVAAPAAPPPRRSGMSVPAGTRASRPPAGPPASFSSWRRGR